MIKPILAPTELFFEENGPPKILWGEKQGLELI
jgi:hypothetical protein